MLARTKAVATGARWAAASLQAPRRGFSAAAASTPARRWPEFVPADRPGPSWSLQDYASLGRAADVKIEPITPPELAHLAQLSHLSLPSTEADRAALLSDVESVVEWVATIRSLDMSKFEPMYTPLELAEYYAAAAERSDADKNTSATPAAQGEDLSDPSRRDGTRLRPDAVTDGGLEKPLLANASFAHRGFFVVPKVVDLEDS